MSENYTQARLEERLFDLVAATREKLRPFLVLETSKTGTMPTTYLAVDIILQEAFERMAAQLDEVVAGAFEAAAHLMITIATFHNVEDHILLREELAMNIRALMPPASKAALNELKSKPLDEGFAARVRS